MKFAQRLIAYLLSLQILFGPLVVFAHTGDSGAASLSRLQVEHVEPGQDWVTASYFREYSKDALPVISPDAPWVRDAHFEERDLAALDLHNDVVVVQIPALQLYPVYDAQKKELAIHRVTRNVTDDRMVVSHSYIYKGIELSSPKIETDANFIYVATREGVRAISIALMAKNFGASSVPALRVYRAAPGDVVQSVSVLRYESQPREFAKGGAYFNNGEDLSIEILRNEEIVHDKIDESEVLRVLSMQYYKWFLYLQMVNPDLDQLSPFLQIIRENEAEWQEAVRVEKEIYFEGADAPLENDMVAHALSNPRLKSAVLAISQKKGGRDLLDKILRQNQNGRNAFKEKSMKAPELVKVADWSEQYAALTDQNDGSAPGVGDRKTWLEKSLAAYEEKMKSGDLKRADGKKWKAARNFWEKSKEWFVSLATPKRMKRVAWTLAGAGALYGLNVLSDGALAENGLRGLSIAYEMAERYEGFAKIAHSFQAIPENFSKYSFNRWLGSTVLYMAILPGAMYATYLWQKRNAKQTGVSQTMFQSFFGLLSRLYGLFCYPVQKIAFEKVGRRSLLYPALFNGVNPLASTAPWASTARHEDASVKIKNQIVANAESKKDALVIAAMLVSKASEGTDGEVDMVSLIQNALGRELDRQGLVDAYGNYSDFEDLLVRVKKLVVKMGDEGPSEAMSPDDVAGFAALFQEIKAEMNGQEPGLLQRGARNARKVAAYVKTHMSRLTLAFTFGGAGYEEYLTFYRQPNIDRATADIVGEAAIVDNPLATVLGALADVKGVAGLWALDPDCFRAFSNQFQQALQWGIMGPIPAFVSAKNKYDGLSPNESPMARLLMNHFGGRSQTFGEGVDAIMRGFADPSPAAMRATSSHLATLRNAAVDGFQVRFLIDFPIRAMAMWGKATTMMAQNAAVHFDLSWILFNSAIIGASFFTVKSAFLVTGFGYAVVWPYIQTLTRHLKTEAAKTTSILEAAYQSIENSIKVDDAEMIEASVDLLQKIYKLGGREMPLIYSKPAEEFSAQDAIEFRQYAIENPPLATQQSRLISAILLNGIVGAVVTTVLATQAGIVAFDLTKLEPFKLLLMSLGALVSTGLLLQGAEAGELKLAQVLAKRFSRKDAENGRAEVVALCESLTLQARALTR